MKEWGLFYPLYGDSILIHALTFTRFLNVKVDGSFEWIRLLLNGEYLFVVQNTSHNNEIALMIVVASERRRWKNQSKLSSVLSGLPETLSVMKMTNFI